MYLPHLAAVGLIHFGLKQVLKIGEFRIGMLHGHQVTNAAATAISVCSTMLSTARYIACGAMSMQA